MYLDILYMCKQTLRKNKILRWEIPNDVNQIKAGLITLHRGRIMYLYLQASNSKQKGVNNWSYLDANKLEY